MFRQFIVIRFLHNYRNTLGTAKEVNRFSSIGVPRIYFISKIQRSLKSFPPVWFWLPKRIRHTYEYFQYWRKNTQILTEEEVITQKYKRLGALHRTLLEDALNDCIENGYVEPITVIDQNDPQSDEVSYIKPTKDGREYAKWTGFINKIIEKRSHLITLITGGGIVGMITFLVKIFS